MGAILWHQHWEPVPQRCLVNQLWPGPLSMEEHITCSHIICIINNISSISYCQFRKNTWPVLAFDLPPFVFYHYVMCASWMSKKNYTAEKKKRFICLPQQGTDYDDVPGTQPGRDRAGQKVMQHWFQNTSMKNYDKDKEDTWRPLISSLLMQ